MPRQDWFTPTNTTIYWNGKVYAPDHSYELPGVPGVSQDDRQLLPARFNPSGFEACYVPGLQATDYRVFNAAKLVPANTDMVFQVLHHNSARP